MIELKAGEKVLVSERESAEVDHYRAGPWQVALFSRRNPHKERNEDSAAIDYPGGERLVIAVADGAGGMPAAAQASRLAVESLARTVEEAIAADHELRVGVLDGFEAANQAVRHLGVGAGTTLTAAAIEEGLAQICHAGDSEALLTGQRGRIKYQSLSHSPVAYAVESGLLESREAMHHEERYIVSNLIGTEQMHIDVGPRLALARRDTLVIASDGLFDNLYANEVVELVRRGPLEWAAAALAQRAVHRMDHPVEGEPSKPDDLTFILVRPAGAH